MKTNESVICDVPTLQWIGGASGWLRMIDQRLLPIDVREIECRSVEQVAEAIRSLRVRGAPAIGVAAAYGVVLGLQPWADGERQEWKSRLGDVIDLLAQSRPTAVNLFWALERMRQVADCHPNLSSSELVERLLEEARQIEAEDRETCARIGRIGAELLSDNQGVLTHCNAGSLATAGEGTALSVIYAAVREGKRIHMFADETRPLLQGARLTTWELSQRGVPVTLICDSAAGCIMQRRRVDAVITGADRIAANGDTANKIGTYSVAVLARAHDIPFYVAAPCSTFDLSLPSGASVPIEERAPEEITHGFGTQTAPMNTGTFNPAFDVTPAELITAIITERGLIRPVTAEEIEKAMSR